MITVGVHVLQKNAGLPQAPTNPFWMLLVSTYYICFKNILDPSRHTYMHTCIHTWQQAMHVCMHAYTPIHVCSAVAVVAAADDDDDNDDALVWKANALSCIMDFLSYVVLFL